MHSYTSSSRERAPKENYLSVLLMATFLTISLISLIEWRIRDAGLLPNVRDSKELWAAQRKRASYLGRSALILVGNSRLQLGIDVDTLRVATGLEPIQLAIDGSSFMPVLENLANDSSVSGTILVDTQASGLLPNSRPDRATEWVEFYSERFRGLYSPMLETQFKSLVMEYSALYSSAIPFAFYPSVISGERRTVPLYLLTEKNRERDADYQLVEMPLFYANRVLSTLASSGQRLSVQNWDEFNRKVSIALNALSPKNNADYIERISGVYALIRKIEQRGARIIFLRMPTDKLIWEVDSRTYPRTEFWDLFSSKSTAPTIHFKDYARLSDFNLPDGSHLDKRDKKRFTASLGKILNQELVKH